MSNQNGSRRKDKINEKITWEPDKPSIPVEGEPKPIGAKIEPMLSEVPEFPGVVRESSGWNVYNNEAKKADIEMVKDWNASLNFLLLFVGRSYKLCFLHNKHFRPLFSPQFSLPSSSTARSYFSRIQRMSWLM